MIEVFSYDDYRRFLRDYYVERKRERGLSYRSISKQAGLKSSNYFKLVLDGERNLSEEMAGRFAEAVHLSGEKAEYFCDLVRFNQAKSEKSRARHFERLGKYRGYRKVHPLGKDEAKYHSTWYLPAIFELVVSRDFVDDPQWIARTLRPKITNREAESAIRTLLSLGLLKRDIDGKLSQSEALVSTGPEAASVHIANYHRTMMKMAEESLNSCNASERDISSLTLCLGPQGLAVFKEKLQKIRRELLELSNIEKDPKQVVQLNFQLFPLSEQTSPLPPGNREND